MVDFQRILNCRSRIFRESTSVNLASEAAVQSRREQRIMGAAKHERVDPFGNEGRKIRTNRNGRLT